MPKWKQNIALAVALGLQSGCNHMSWLNDCSTEMREGPLDNSDTGRVVGVDLTLGRDLGIAYTYDKRGDVTGAAYLLADVCGFPGSRRTKAFHILYVPTATHLDVRNAQQVADSTVLDMDVSDLKEMTPIVRLVGDFPAQGSAVTPEDYHSGLALLISCGTACDQTKLHVRHRQFGRSKMFLWFQRDATHISPL